jgi:hypothetical protein
MRATCPTHFILMAVFGEEFKNIWSSRYAFVVSLVVLIVSSVVCMCSQTSPLFHTYLYWCDQNIGFPLHVEQISITVHLRFPFRPSSSFILTEVWNDFARFTQACSHGPHRWMKWEILRVECVIIWQGAVMLFLKIRARKFSGPTEENHEKPEWR